MYLYSLDLLPPLFFLGVTRSKEPETTTYESHGPACIASHCSHLFITKSNPWSVSQIAKTWVSLQITTCISKSNKYFDIVLQLTCEEVLQAPIVQV